MRVLLVEDQGPSAQAAAGALVSELGCEVDVVHDPARGVAQLADREYDVVVVDVLFRSVTEEFDRRRLQRVVRLDDEVLHLSGLAVIDAARQCAVSPVVWSSGEPNRHLHLLFAQEELWAKVFCAKVELDALVTATKAAAEGEEYIDPDLSYYVPNVHGRPLRETILSQPRKLALWRATALGEHQHGALAKMTGMSAKAVRTSMGEMRARLAELDPGVGTDNAPSSDVVRFAGRNWEFFLDDTVRRYFE